MKRIVHLVDAVLRSPLVWGALATAAFYAPLELGYWHSPFVHRYFAGHPVERVATALFLVGIAALVLRALDVAAQRAAAHEPVLGPLREQGQSAEHSAVLLDRLARLPLVRQRHYLVRRLREALQYVARKRSADTLDEHLRYLADLDVARMHASYSLVRIIIWAIPILGLLGTVIGITAAVANLSPESLQESVSQVTAGLGVAFDHTALALALSIGLMFGQFVVERSEQRLMAEVDDRAEAELVGRFAETAGSGDPNVAVTRRMAESLLGAAEQLVVRQAELWQATIAEAQRDWTQLAQSAGGQLQAALAAALCESLARHAEALCAAEAQQAQRNLTQWGQVQQSLVDTAGATVAQQRELARQGEVLAQVVAATGQVARLEDELNRNLASLSAAQHLDETLASLAAAVNLLVARLAQVNPDAPAISLAGAARSSKAA